MFETSTLHGYNPLYRYVPDEHEGRFAAFAMHAHRPRPERFHFEAVAGTQLYDHQGHIVPQASYQPRLVQIADTVYQQLRTRPTYNLNDVNNLLTHLYPLLNFQSVTTYIIEHLQTGGAEETLFVDPTGNDLEACLGGYFSVINWNPVNICRAPSDEYRNGQPGNNPDIQVVTKLLADPNDPGITLSASYQAFLQRNIGNLTGNIDDFITSSNASLGPVAVGFYQFTWGVAPAV